MTALLRQSCSKTLRLGLLHDNFNISQINKRTWFSFKGTWIQLLSIINQVHYDRIKEVGRDRACTEWLVKNGGKVKWKGLPHWENHYNDLPQTNFDKFKIEEIVCDEAVVLPNGFGYLAGLEHVKKFVLHDCPYASDSMVYEISNHLKDCLEHLQVSSCPTVTEAGLVVGALQLRNLKELVLSDLKKIQDETACVNQLKKNLPSHCEVKFVELKPKQEQPPEGG